MNYRRADRVAKQIQQELARIAQRDLRDPRIGLVTFTAVELSPDNPRAKQMLERLRSSE